MIQEVALLDVIPGMEDDFLSAFGGAQQYITGIQGYRSHTLCRCLESPSRFLLSVYWDSVESHEIGFRQSAEYTQWKAALHRFYEPFPIVEHFSAPRSPGGVARMGLPANITTLLLDLNGTFMFGHDRFGPQENYYRTYQAHGGRTLKAQYVQETIAQAVAVLATAYELEGAAAKEAPGQPGDAFPTVRAALHAIDPELPEREHRRLADVIAAHELGSISLDHRHALNALADRFQLIVVSNLWSASAPWRAYLAALPGKPIADAVFSSDHGRLKPDAALFHLALDRSNSTPGTAAMVGDDYARDIVPAQQLAMTTIWVTDSSAEGAPDQPTDYRIEDFSALPTLTL